MKKFLFLFIVLILVGCQSNNKSNKWGGDERIIKQHDTIVVKSFITQWRDNHTQALCFTWDDTTPGHEEVADIFDRYNLKATFYIVTTQYDHWKTRLYFHRQRRKFFNYTKLLKSGHEIGSHTAHHCNMIHASLDSVYKECQQSSKYIYGKFGYYPATLSHPTSHYNEAVDSVVHLHYLDSRYSTKKDNDSTIVFMHVRANYPFSYYKSSIDSFAISNKKQYVFGGHELDGWGYEPMRSGILDSLLSYVKGKYDNQFWITTFENLTMYKYLLDNVIIEDEPGVTIINIGNVKETMDHFSHPDAIITLCYPEENLDFYSDGLVSYWYEKGNSYASIDFRKSNKLYYRRSEF